MIQEEGATKIEWAARLKKRSGPLDYNIGRCVPMWESGTPIGATGTDTALNFHVYCLLSSRVSVCRRELDFRCFLTLPCLAELLYRRTLLEVRRKQTTCFITNFLGFT